MFELNKKEKQLATRLQAIESNSEWVAWLKEVLRDGPNWKIRRLFADMKSELWQDQQTMRLTIGQECVQLLKTI